MSLLNANQKKHIQRWGILRTAYALLMRSIKKNINFFFCVITTRPLNQGSPPPNPTPEIDYRLITEKELIEFCTDPELDLTPTDVCELCSLGHLCAGAVIDGKLISYVWRSYGPTQHTDDIWIGFNSHCRYGFKSLTKEAFRGQRIHSYVTIMTEEETRKDKTHTVGFIETHNYPSRHSSAFHGGTEVGYAGYIELFGNYYIFHSPGAKKSGFHFFEKR
jgi:hypothetical protein